MNNMGGWVRTRKRQPKDGEQIIGTWQPQDSRLSHKNGWCMVRDQWNQKNYEEKMRNGELTYAYWRLLPEPPFPRKSLWTGPDIFMAGLICGALAVFIVTMVCK